MISAPKPTWAIQCAYYVVIRLALQDRLKWMARECREYPRGARNWLPQIRETAAVLAYWRRTYYGTLPTDGLRDTSFHSPPSTLHPPSP